LFSQVTVAERLPVLYLLDSVVKNVEDPYARHFAALVPKTFYRTYELAGDSMRRALNHLLQTWQTVFPRHVLTAIRTSVTSLNVNVGPITNISLQSNQTHLANDYSQTTNLAIENCTLTTGSTPGTWRSSDGCTYQTQAHIWQDCSTGSGIACTSSPFHLPYSGLHGNLALSSGNEAAAIAHNQNFHLASQHIFPSTPTAANAYSTETHDSKSVQVQYNSHQRSNINMTNTLFNAQLTHETGALATQSAMGSTSVASILGRLVESGLFETTRSGDIHVPSAVQIVTRNWRQLSHTKIMHVLNNSVSAVVKTLYDDLSLQCKATGQRFGQSNTYSGHIDKLYLRRKRVKDVVVRSRPWFVHRGAWLMGTKLASCVDHANTSPTEVAHRRAVSVPVDETQQVCMLSGEPFTKFWSEEHQAWHFRDAIRLERDLGGLKAGSLVLTAALPKAQEDKQTLHYVRLPPTLSKVEVQGQSQQAQTLESDSQACRREVLGSRITETQVSGDIESTPELVKPSERTNLRDADAASLEGVPRFSKKRKQSQSFGGSTE